MLLRIVQRKCPLNMLSTGPQISKMRDENPKILCPTSCKAGPAWFFAWARNCSASWRPFAHSAPPTALAH